MGSHRTMVIKHSPVVVEGKKGTKLNNFHITRQISKDMSRLSYRFARYLFVMLVCSGPGWIIDFVAKEHCQMGCVQENQKSDKLCFLNFLNSNQYFSTVDFIILHFFKG